MAASRPIYKWLTGQSKFYTEPIRKSSEEGLEQAFNSLDAQREVCAAFILSQKHEGWTVLPTLYDDGGFSGGTMERPALKGLIADIEAGQIDVVVDPRAFRFCQACRGRSSSKQKCAATQIFRLKSPRRPISFICGAILAVLTRGNKPRLSRRAKMRKRNGCHSS
jgi:hypothetical protein